MLFLVVLFCTMSMYLAVLTTADHESRTFFVQGTKIEGEDTHCCSSCPVSLKLNQVLLVKTEPVSIAAWLIVLIVMILVLYSTALNLYFAFIITTFERVFIQGARVERQQPWDERAAADRTDNLAVNGNRAFPQQHPGWPPWVGKWHFFFFLSFFFLIFSFFRVLSFRRKCESSVFSNGEQRRRSFVSDFTLEYPLTRDIFLQ